MKLRITPLVMFFILLIALLVSVMFAYMLPEGFISYNSTGGPLSQLVVPPYSSSWIYKVYDSVYFDPNSGNVLELFGSPAGSNNSDSSVASLTNLLVMPPTGSSVNQYDKSGSGPFGNNMVESSLVSATPPVSFNSWVYPGANTANTLSFNYQVVYVPWGKDVVVIIYDIVNKVFQGVYTFTQASGTTSQYNVPASVTLASTNIPDTDPANDTYTDATKNTTYQVTHSVSFNTSSRTLTPSATGTASTVAMADTTGGNVVVAVPFSNNRTLVVVMCPDPANTTLVTLRNVVRFDPSAPGGVVTGTINSTTPTPSTTTCTTPAVTTTPTPGSGSQCPDISNYVLKTQVIPPICPACPSCPSVSNNVSCPACGQQGTGGHGTDASNNTLANIIADAYAQTLQSQGRYGSNSLGGVSNNLVNQTAGLGNNLVNQTAGLGNNVVDTAGGLAGGALLGATGLGLGAEMLASDIVSTVGQTVQGVAGTAGQVAQSAIGGVTKLGTGAEEGVTKLGTSAIGGVTELGKDATTLGTSAIGGVSGVANNAIYTAGNLGSGPAGPSQGRGGAGNYQGDLQGNRGYMGTGVATGAAAGSAYNTAGAPGFNNYYGAIPPRPTTNFIPVTSDFSKFGR
jgi:hypothetical protein